MKNLKIFYLGSRSKIILITALLDYWMFCVIWAAEYLFSHLLPEGGSEDKKNPFLSAYLNPGLLRTVSARLLSLNLHNHSWVIVQSSAQSIIKMFKFITHKKQRWHTEHNVSNLKMKVDFTLISETAMSVCSSSRLSISRWKMRN